MVCLEELIFIRKINVMMKQEQIWKKQKKLLRLSLIN